MRDFPRATLRTGAAVAAAATLTGTAFTGTGLAEPASTGARHAPAWCKPGGTLSARTMPQRVRIADCDLRGRAVRGANGLTAVVPSDGTSLVAHALRTDGGAELRIRVDERAGLITLDTRGGRAPHGRPRGFRAPAAACADGTHRAEPSKWRKGAAVQWHYYAGAAGLSRAPIAAGVSNMANARTDCNGGRFSLLPDVGENYAGQANRPPNVTGAAACGKRDRVNTFGWLSMQGADNDVLAATCTWYLGSATVETDMALQVRGKKWWTGGTCPAGAYSAEAVATHEAGHVFGLAHVEGIEHENLTMAPALASCDRGPATLGRGDYNGLIALYGGR
ncbi:matrixin family metalloprotease [Actinomadura geliboluensis]|uniref:matrixin family metalloprotease n=1 Tax=Actinomadura geliboluensis TaxID=882440 RepID=UPI00371D3426